MTNTTFTFKTATIRTALIDNEPWFVANDVCNALSLDTTYGARNHLRKIVEGEKKLATMGELGLVTETSASPGGNRSNTKVYVVNESGLYKLIMRSDKKEAQEFQHWIASEVLPSIRKTGKYDLTDHGRAEMPMPADIAAAFNLLVEQVQYQGTQLDLLGRKLNTQPTHDDKTASLKVTDGKDGKLLVHCHAGCDNRDVINELKARNLWPEADERYRPTSAGGTAVAANDNRKPKAKPKIVAKYDYFDHITGKLKMQVVRLEPKGCRSSRFSRSNAFRRSASSVGTPARLPLFTSAFLIRAHNLEHSMSRRGNCHDNAVAEARLWPLPPKGASPALFSCLKRERIRRRTYKTREEARQDVFDYIEMFCNPVRKHVRNGMLSPTEFERQQILKAKAV